MATDIRTIRIIQAVHAAVERDELGVVTKYLDDGGSVESFNYIHHQCLLLTAVYSCNVRCMTLLLDRGANVDAVNNHEWRPLDIAATKGLIEGITLLLDRGAEIDAIDNMGWTALHMAVLNGQVDCIQLLLDRGANREIIDAKGRKPIDLCAKIENLKLCEQMRELLMSGGGQATKAAKPRR